MSIEQQLQFLWLIREYRLPPLPWCGVIVFGREIVLFTKKRTYVL